MGQGQKETMTKREMRREMMLRRLLMDRDVGVTAKVVGTAFLIGDFRREITAEQILDALVLMTRLDERTVYDALLELEDREHIEFMNLPGIPDRQSSNEFH
jgi:hypothetical protein